MKKKNIVILVVAIVAVLVLVYVIALLTGNVKQPESSDSLSSSQSIDQEAITSLEFGEDRNFGIEEIGGQVLSWVKVNTNQYSTEDLEAVLVNPDVAEVQFTDKSGKNQWFRIVAKKSGRTGFYIQTKDGEVKTKTIVISVDRTEEELNAIS